MYFNRGRSSRLNPAVTTPPGSTCPVAFELTSGVSVTVLYTDELTVQWYQYTSSGIGSVHLSRVLYSGSAESYSGTCDTLGAELFGIDDNVSIPVVSGQVIRVRLAAESFGTSATITATFEASPVTQTVVLSGGFWGDRGGLRPTWFEGSRSYSDPSIPNGWDRIVQYRAAIGDEIEDLDGAIPNTLLDGADSGIFCFSGFVEDIQYVQYRVTLTKTGFADVLGVWTNAAGEFDADNPSISPAFGTVSNNACAVVSGLAPTIMTIDVVFGGQLPDDNSWVIHYSLHNINQASTDAANSAWESNPASLELNSDDGDTLELRYFIERPVWDNTASAVVPAYSEIEIIFTGTAIE